LRLTTHNSKLITHHCVTCRNYQYSLLMPTIPLAALRRHVVAWQRFNNRHRRANPEEVLEIVRRLSCVQLDSIATVERSHLLVLGTRAGAVEAEAVSTLLKTGRLFEYWAHEASLLPIEDWPLFQRRMRKRHTHQWWGPVIDSDPALAARVMDAIRENGQLGSRHFEGRGGGGMWRLKPAKRMLDALWTAGRLVVAGRQGFQRLYDLPERVLPSHLLSTPILSEPQTLRALILRAVEARGALTASGIVDHYRLSGGTARIAGHLNALCKAGKIRALNISDEGPPVYVPAGSDPLAAEVEKNCVLLSPFENLLWDRAFARRLFGFDHVIEVYKREPDRIYGYYVLPFLLGDRIVGRADLKADRGEGILHVKAFHIEAGFARTTKIASGFERAVARLGRMTGLTPRFTSR